MKELTTGEEILEGEVVSPPKIIWEEWEDERNGTVHFHLKLTSQQRYDLGPEGLSIIQKNLSNIKEVICGCFMY